MILLNVCRTSSVVIGTAHEVTAALAQQLAAAAGQALIAIRAEEHGLFGDSLFAF